MGGPNGVPWRACRTHGYERARLVGCRIDSCHLAPCTSMARRPFKRAVQGHRPVGKWRERTCASSSCFILAMSSASLGLARVILETLRLPEGMNQRFKALAYRAFWPLEVRYRGTERARSPRGALHTCSFPRRKRTACERLLTRRACNHVCYVWTCSAALNASNGQLWHDPCAGAAQGQTPSQLV